VLGRRKSSHARLRSDKSAKMLMMIGSGHQLFCSYLVLGSLVECDGAVNTLIGWGVVKVLMCSSFPPP